MKNLSKIYMSLIFVILILNVGCKKSNSDLTTENQIQTSTTNDKEPSNSIQQQRWNDEKSAVYAQPKTIDFKNMDITTENVRSFLNEKVNNDFMANISNIKITNENKKITVNLYYEPNKLPSFTAILYQTCKLAVITMEVLFNNPKIDQVMFWTDTDQKDDKGNLSKQNIVNICLTKKNAKDINWAEFKKMVLNDYNALLRIADSYYIEPDIMVALQIEEYQKNS